MKDNMQINNNYEILNPGWKKTLFDLKMFHFKMLKINMHQNVSQENVISKHLTLSKATIYSNTLLILPPESQYFLNLNPKRSWHTS